MQYVGAGPPDEFERRRDWMTRRLQPYPEPTPTRPVADRERRKRRERRQRRKRRTTDPVVLSLVSLFLLGGSTAAVAQSEASASGGAVKWSLLDGIGYGGLGFGLGLMAALDLEYGPGAAVVAGTAVAGTVAGALIGKRAGETIDAGRRLQGAHRIAAISGIVMAGGTLGALAAVPLVNSEGEGTFLGSDERTVASLVLAGTALSAVYLWSRRDQLASRKITVAPGASGASPYGMRVRVTF